MKKLIARFLVSAVLFTSVFSADLSAQVVTKKSVGLELAKKIAAAAEAESAKNHWTMAIAIVDDGGNLVYFARMDGTQIGSVEVAVQKARSAILFKRPTKVFEDAISKDGRTALLGLPGSLPIEGGLPIVVDGVPIGAIGISGAKASEDGLVAQAALSALPAQ